MTLKEKQALPLEEKIKYTEERLLGWICYWKGLVYVSFSGGQDSTVLLHILRKLVERLLQDYELDLDADLRKAIQNIPAVFVDTGLEYPEIRDFVKTKNNVVWLRPEMSFRKVIEKYGYPVPSKLVAMAIDRYRKAIERGDETQSNIRFYGGVNPSSGKYQKMGTIPDKWKDLAMNAPFKISEQCCVHIKEKPLNKYGKETGRKAIVGMRATESNLRGIVYEKKGCNAYDDETPISAPLSFWLDKDIQDYIKLFNVPYSKIYDMGEQRTGCMFCPFGVHLEKGLNRFQRMAKSHPKQYKYCIETLGIGKVLDFIKVDYKRYKTLMDF